MKKVFIDTNILIDYSKKYTDILRGLLERKKNNKLKLIINPIVIVEYLNDFNLVNEEKLTLAEKFLQMFDVFDINTEIAVITAELLRTKKVIYIGDAIIAATCIHHNLLLATNNKKDFRKVKELKFYK